MSGLHYSWRVNPQDNEVVRRAFERIRTVGKKPRRALGLLGLFVMRWATKLLKERVHDWGASRGLLSRSLTRFLDDHSVIVGSNLVYAAIQQLGGTILPKGGKKYLAIPVLPHLQKQGVWARDIPRDQMRFAPKVFIRVGTHFWIGPALVRATSAVSGAESTAIGKYRQNRGAGGKFVKGGAHDATAKPAEREEGEVMFALVKRAKIKGRPYLVFGPQAIRFLLVELEKDFRSAFRGI